jgi:hypothetical protein
MKVRLAIAFGVFIVVAAFGMSYVSSRLDAADMLKRDSTGNAIIVHPNGMVEGRRPCKFAGFKSAVNGRWVTREYALDHPSSTYHVCVR